MKSIIKVFRWIDKFLLRFERGFCSAGILIITALIFLAVICRTFFKFSFSWLEELCQYLMVWIACMGGVVCVGNNEHVGVDLIFSILPKRLHPYYRLILAAVSAIFLGYFAYISVGMVTMIQKTGQASISMPWLEMYWIYVAVLLSCGLMCLEYIKVCWRLLSGIRKGSDRSEPEEKALDKLETM